MILSDQNNKIAGAYSGCETGGISEVGELEVFSVLGTTLEEASFTSTEDGLTASGWLASLTSVVCRNIPGEYTFFNTSKKSIHKVTSAMEF